jgi:tetratricopeptide (TPR) repeat protein
MNGLALLRTMSGEPAAARVLIHEARRRFHELGRVFYAEGTAYAEAMIELHDGNADAAEQALRPAIATLDEIGEAAFRSMLLGLLAAILARQGRVDESLELSERSRQLAAARVSHAYWRAARAHALVQTGAADEAVVLAREAVEVLGDTDDLHTLGDVRSFQADVLARAGDFAAARLALEETIAAFEQKGCVICSARAHEELTNVTSEAKRRPES